MISNFLTIIFLGSMVLFDFQPDSQLNDWFILDDVVMGGRSSGNFGLNEAGNAVFSGEVSLENNGGFSSVHYRFPVRKVKSKQKVVMRLRGDGKSYQFRVKTRADDAHSYIRHFETTGEWQEIELDLNDLKPQFRGRALKMADYPGESMEEIAFLIANKRAESFQLELDWIRLH